MCTCVHTHTHTYFWVTSISFQRPLICTWGVLIQLVVVVCCSCVGPHLSDRLKWNDCTWRRSPPELLCCYISKSALFLSWNPSPHSTPTYSSFRPPAGVTISDVLLLTLYVQEQCLSNEDGIILVPISWYSRSFFFESSYQTYNVCDSASRDDVARAGWGDLVFWRGLGLQCWFPAPLDVQNVGSVQLVDSWELAVVSP